MILTPLDVVAVALAVLVANVAAVALVVKFYLIPALTGPMPGMGGGGGGPPSPDSAASSDLSDLIGDEPTAEVGTGDLQDRASEDDDPPAGVSYERTDG